MIPYGRQDISDEDIAAVTEVLRSDFLTQGPAVPAFESAIAAVTGARHAVAVNSATSALHIACMALDVGPGDVVWTSPISFVASANCARYCGAEVDFVDIDPRTYNMDPAALEAKLREADRAGRLPKVIIPVHMTGQSANMEAIHSLAKERGVRVVEDASHAIGGSYRGSRIGAGLFCDITVFSFHPVKIITTGEGGLLTTEDDRLATRLRHLRTHGITRDAASLEDKSQGAWYYEQQELGYNYRMTDIQAALGVSQLKRLDTFIERRRALARRYDEMLRGLPVVTPFQTEKDASAWHLYVVLVDQARTSRTRREVFDAMRASGIGVNVHYISIPSQPYYRKLGFYAGRWPVALDYSQRTISLPMFATLTEADQDRVVRALQSSLGNV